MPRFRDARLRYFVNSIIPFSRESVSDAISSLWRERDPFGAEEEIYALTFLQVLNVTTDRFSLMDPYFTRGPVHMSRDIAHDLACELVSQLPDDAKLAGAGVTSSLNSGNVLPAMEKVMARMHTERLSEVEYRRIEAVQNLLALSLLLPYLPKYVRRDVEKMRQSLDTAVEERLGPGVTRRDLQAIAMAVEMLR